jgi:hypothetical protein
MQSYTTSHLNNKKREGCSIMGIRWLEGRGLHTIRNDAQIFDTDRGVSNKALPF